MDKKHLILSRTFTHVDNNFFYLVKLESKWNSSITYSNDLGLMIVLRFLLEEATSLKGMAPKRRPSCEKCPQTVVAVQEFIFCPK